MHDWFLPPGMPPVAGPSKVDRGPGRRHAVRVAFFGFAAVIAKPYNTERLEEVIRQVITTAKA